MNSSRGNLWQARSPDDQGLYGPTFNRAGKAFKVVVITTHMLDRGAPSRFGAPGTVMRFGAAA